MGGTINSVKRKTNNIRSRIALILVSLFCAIVASGTAFMHKHTTRDGRIVIHTHPFDLKTDPDTNPHHQSESEIHLLDAIFQGRFLPTDFTTYDQPIAEPFEVAYRSHRPLAIPRDAASYHATRAPPHTN